jgi:hypothetical protein
MVSGSLMFRVNARINLIFSVRRGGKSILTMTAAIGGIPLAVAPADCH